MVLDVQQAGSFKQTAGQETLCVRRNVIDVIQTFSRWKLTKTYFADTAEQKDYDIDIPVDVDYSDPKTYLAILDPETGSQLE